MSKGLIWFLLILGMIIPVTNAQSSNWQAVLYDITAYNLLFVSDEGLVETVQLPSAVWTTPDVNMDVIAVSPNGQYAVVKQYIEGRSFLVNLHDLNCCRQLVQVGASTELITASFSPDSARLAVNYLVYPPAPNDSPYGLLAIVDVVSNQIITTITSNHFGQQWGVATLEIEWTPEGVTFFPNCWACEPSLEGERMLWDFNTGTATPTGEYVSLAGDVLLKTVEWIYGADDTRFAYSQEPYGMLPPYNVIVWRLAEGNEIVIYHDPSNLNLPVPRWIEDGQAFIMYHYGGAVARRVYRDGQIRDLPISADEVFLTGTPDGWLAFHPQEGLVGYKDGQRRLLAKETGPLVVLRAPSLGETIKQPFAGLPIPEPLVCQGALPSRLAVGRYGRVTSGAPNNLRAQPSVTATLIGQLPADAFFAILEGPICADGYAWYRVDYQGTTGWTAEADAVSYWLEPAE